MVDALENFKRNGLHLLGQHGDDFPEGYRHWAQVAYAMTVADVTGDCVMRTVVYDAIPSVFEDDDLLVTPTLATLPVQNADTPGATVGPSELEGVESTS